MFFDIAEYRSETKLLFFKRQSIDKYVVLCVRKLGKHPKFKSTLLTTYSTRNLQT